MPLTQKKRHNPLMLGYFAEIGASDTRLSAECGVGRSQIHMAKHRNVGSDNAEKISHGVARLLELSDEERLRLKAEIMGDPDNLLRAYLGGARIAARTLDEHESRLAAIFDSERTIAHTLSERVAEKLEEMDAPQFLVEDVRSRALPAYRPPGRITYTRRGSEVARERREARRSFSENKPRTHAALRASGMSVRDLYETADVGRETLRKALYERCGRKAAAKIAEALRNALELSDAQTETIRDEMLRDSK